MGKILIGIVLIILLVAVFAFTRRTKTTEQEDQKKGPGKVTAFTRHDPGLVCVGQDNFSFRSNGPYSILQENKNAIALTSDGKLLTVAKSDNDAAQTLEALLENYPVSFTKDGGLFTYALREQTQAISTVKDNFVISVFYKSPTSKEQAGKLLESTVASLKGDCNDT